MIELIDSLNHYIVSWSNKLDNILTYHPNIKWWFYLEEHSFNGWWRPETTWKIYKSDLFTFGVLIDIREKKVWLWCLKLNLKIY